MSSNMLNKFKEVYAYRELLISLSVKDFKVRYKSASLGFLWTILNPLFLMVVFSVVFSLITRIQIEKYPVFLLTGLIPWTFFTLSLSNATHSIIDNANLIKKVNFPRGVIPLSIILANLYNFLLSLSVLFVFLFFFKVNIGPQIMLLPFVILLQIIFLVGICLLTSSLNVVYRDVKFIVEAILVAWFYGTPIFYSLDMVPKKLYFIWILNPMTGIVSIYREILFYGRLPDLKLTCLTILIVTGIFLLGINVFKKNEPTFADLV
ncbi:ABC transporter permease [Thermoproteota archaeon]